MNKFDTSSGLGPNEIHAIKFALKTVIAGRLPLLPDHIETNLFLQGRSAWMFYWHLKDECPIPNPDRISLEVVVKLKKEFHKYSNNRTYTYSCDVKRTEDEYNPKVSVTELHRK